MNHNTEQEMRDRLRRIETRLTSFMQAQGFDTQAQKPLWNNGAIHIPSRSCAIGECVDMIPGSWDPSEPIDVFCKGDYITTIYKEAEEDAE